VIILNKLKSILIVFFIGIIAIPWESLGLCLTHPLGHQHHHHGNGPSPCELRKQFKGLAYFPPMECKKFTVKLDNYKIPDKIQIKPSFEKNELAEIIIHFLSVLDKNQTFIRQTTTRCRSALIISANTLRGPPLV